MKNITDKDIDWSIQISKLTPGLTQEQQSQRLGISRKTLFNIRKRLEHDANYLFLWNIVNRILDNNWNPEDNQDVFLVKSRIGKQGNQWDYEINEIYNEALSFRSTQTYKDLVAEAKIYAANFKAVMNNAQTQGAESNILLEQR